ncbi:plasma membrane iron permease [Phialemonium atrogriseum]|uniref:Plasma membrane iron permease n=1 Tax=Phialemonium atrogriseum TaxID=1093897 RepID=A0AAJ0BU17_9PEZI|nr:plasma membrane iron permease [Phialemonium atrogriseum]KAK1762021.1 plasma membrane iron permease [Phialemonium atrogriseum]
MAKDVFAVQIFFIVFRECLEATIIISVLFSFLKQCLGDGGQDTAVYKRLVRQVWLGAAAGVVVCLIIGGAFIGVFYGLGKDVWAQSEDLWEGIFYLIATIIISIMGLALLRINKMKEKWRLKIAQALAEKSKTRHVSTWLGDWSRRHVMFILPFITTLREGVEAVVFVGGVSLSLPATSFPLPVVCGIIAALLIGFLMYRGGNLMSIQIFLIASTSVLYLIAAGMFSKAVWSLQYHVFARRVGSDVAELGDGPGSYDIDQSVWHVNCCNPETDNGWDVFNAILGWQNSATYGSVIAYNVYWIALMLTIACMLYEERTGSLPGKERALSIMVKVPGLRRYAQRKLDSGKPVDADAAVDQARTEVVNTGILHADEG